MSNINQRTSGFKTINVVLRNDNKAELTDENKAFVVGSEELDHTSLREIQAELDKLIGLGEIKKIINEIYAWIRVNELRKQHGLKTEKQSLHMLFKGSPGTGKTTVARLLGRFFANIDVLENGKLHEVERADIVGEYIGHTALKTREVIKKAKGGVLFIDEAYSLARGGNKDFGREAIDTLVKHMEDEQHDFILILAGYSNEMEYFLELNPGLTSRFQIVVDFENFNLDELMKIAGCFLEEKQYLLNSEAFEVLKGKLQASMTEHDFSNGRFVRNLIEKAIRTQSLRVIQKGLVDKDNLMLLKAIDFRN